MKRRMLTGFLAALGMLLLILDSKTAFSGAADAVGMCLRVILPSLFPFFILSVILTNSLTGMSWKILSPLCRHLRIPKGAESLFLIGLLGGYPVGAQAISQAWQSGTLSKQDAHRMLGFCSNAGPAFLFGLIATQFTHGWIPWILWGIHILSAFLTGLFLTGENSIETNLTPSPTLTTSQIMERGLKIMGSVCGWIILFRIILAFIERWFLWYLPPTAGVAVKVLLELANGCLSLSTIQNEAVRFILCACGLSLGGICVAMQTASVTAPLGLGMYLPGKLIQTAISLWLSLLIINLVPGFDGVAFSVNLWAILTAILTISLVLLQKRKNNSRNLQIVGV